MSRIKPLLSSVFSAGGTGVSRLLPTNTINGTSTRYASTPPATMIEPMRGPMM